MVVVIAVMAFVLLNRKCIPMMFSNVSALCMCFVCVCVYSLVITYRSNLYISIENNSTKMTQLNSHHLTIDLYYAYKVSVSVDRRLPSPRAYDIHVQDVHG